MTQTGVGGTALAESDVARNATYLFDRDRLLDLITTGVVIVDLNQTIRWCNRFFEDYCSLADPVGHNFYQALGECEIEGPDFCPFHTVRKLRHRTTTTVRCGARYFELKISPVWSQETKEVTGCVVEMRDISEITQVDETLKQLLEVGRQLTDLSSRELASLSFNDRIDLLKSRIEKSMRSILKYDVVEIRLLNQQTSRLEPLLAFGMAPEAVQRELYAASSGNGITGFVAHNKVSYYCEETLEHPLYLRGAVNARSSLTVPLLYHDRVIGTCNVESLSPGAFTDRDLYFLQLFTKDVAVAIHTFDLLSFESEKAVVDSVQSILGSISLPLDLIIQETSVLLNQDDLDKTDLVSRLQKILTTSRTIRDRVRSRTAAVTPKSTAAEAEEAAPQKNPLLAGRRILVVDQEEEILTSAHELLEEHDCVVETAPDSLTALNMIRTTNYDVVISEIKPPGGMSGYQLMLRMIELNPERKDVPLLLMTGFGYDGGHTIVNAKQKGLLGVLFKPFVPKQLFKMLEKVITTCGARDASGNLLPGSATSLPASTGTLRESRVGSVEEPTTRTGGFYQKQGASRFDEWARRYTEFARKNMPPGGSEGSPYDAT
ncbi:MAG: response regulator [Planctomycetia bacterium]|nr:response regulator [Planctomycetia bacterium]